jgi:ankyrin repeat protein
MKKTAAKKSRKSFSGPAAKPEQPMFPPINEAAMHGKLSEVKKLLDAGANIEEPDNNDGSTPLILAVRYDHPEIALELIARGANVRAKERGGGTAMIWAATNNMIEVGRKMVEKGADAAVRTQNINPMRVEQDFMDMLAEATAERLARAETKKQAKADAFARALEDAVVLKKKMPIMKPITLKRFREFSPGMFLKMRP